MIQKNVGKKNKDFMPWLKESGYKTPMISWSDFARDRHVKGSGYSYPLTTHADICRIAISNFDRAIPGNGEKDLSRKVIVPLDVEGRSVSDIAASSVALIKPGIPVYARVENRQEGEDVYISNFIYSCDAEKYGIVPEPANFARVVLYSAEALLENGGKRSSDSPWEIVALLVDPTENVPMTPLTCARNMLNKKGGTPSKYTAEYLCECIWYWSQRIVIK